GGVDAHFVGPGVQEPPHVLDAAHASADGERNENLRGHRFDDAQDEIALVAARRDVEKSELVSAFAVVALRDLDRITGVAQAYELHAFHDAARGDVETRDDALR